MSNMHAAIAHTSQIAAAFAARTVVRMDVADNCDQGFEVGIISFIGLRSKQAVRFDDVTDLFDSVSNMLMYIVVEELRPRQRWMGGCGRGTGGCGVDRQTQREAVSECNATMTVSGQWLTKKTGI